MPTGSTKVRRKKMKFSSNKSLNTSIALFLILAFAASLITCLPIVNAQEEQMKESYAVIMAEPDPVGVGQNMLIVLGISEPLPSIPYGWEDLTVTGNKT